ncbi:MAG: hypothetical protein F6J90_04420 [Moorea sp. SIOASIH]|uniref:hypothetical protein n=1 Tax=Moorena sp. SIOASIH TaxID=2607817 RepID=UPI0013BAC562|nr:hypothetical protein [Moorena sp. SIOASIH]NEO35601.1 hypothetical protein [Moorena sp. SIOASIH]
MANSVTQKVSSRQIPNNGSKKEQQLVGWAKVEDSRSYCHWISICPPYTTTTPQLKRKDSAVSGQRSAVSCGTGFGLGLGLGLWPRYANGHATRMATLREWPRCANDAGT